MKILVVSSAPIFRKDGKLYAYPPFVDEMDLWFQYSYSVTIIAPGSYPSDFSLKNFKETQIIFKETPFLQFSNFKTFFQSLLLLPFIINRLFEEMRKTDHIHLRCPGNISLLGCIIQVFFPKKPKTVKYAGNWDPESDQPLSYRLQKWILNNRFLSRNIKVLVYGKWKNQSDNIIPFFTASFSEEEIATVNKEFDGTLKFMFVGSLSEGKRPLIAIKLVEALIAQGVDASLKLYGNGVLLEELEDYIKNSTFSEAISIEGFRNKKELKQRYRESHFLVLPSKSEGWPKAVAEAMFFGCIPVATNVSCVSWMMGEGERGFVIPADPDQAKKIILDKLENRNELKVISKNAQKWSQEYTLERFETEIRKFL